MTSEDSVGGDRQCTTCGKSIEDLPYEFWLFHTCRSCAFEPTIRREKRRYYPRWHFTQHPDRPERIRARTEART